MTHKNARIPLSRYANEIRRYDDCDAHEEVGQLWRNAIAAGYTTDEIWHEIHTQDEREGDE